ncbi:calcium-binding protein [Providencia sneebia]|uniref:Calcium binding hemolysin protein n=1 Tax=Providencia sneebia DSM 19967 TaxID=1141660 RepID=K8WZ84_9GAMM|nr:calcium-binding protein [Providencia sneebia]EKT61520.1 calcium binding hemolysin protein [Providencia sneebia DSM 19967]
MPINIQGYIQENNGVVNFSSDKPEIFKIDPLLNHEITITNFNIGMSKLDLSSLGDIHYWDEIANKKNNINSKQPLSSIAIKNNSVVTFESGNRQLTIVDNKGKLFSINIEFSPESRQIYSLQNSLTYENIRDRTLLDNISLFSDSQFNDGNIVEGKMLNVDGILYNNVFIGRNSQEIPDFIEAPNNQYKHFIYGRKGNDILIGSEGQETYYFELGDGKDTIANISSHYNPNKLYTPDILKFGEGISANNLQMKKENKDLLIEIKDTQDSVRIVSYFNDKRKQGVRIIEFSDGSVMTDKKINENIAKNNPLSLNSTYNQTELLVNMMSTLTNKSGVSSSVDNCLATQPQSMMSAGSNIIFSNNN